MINPDYKTLSGLYSIEHYCGKGYPHDRKSLHLHTFDEISLIENGEITYISDTVSDKVSGKSLIYSKAYHLHNPYINPDKLYSRYQISVNSRAVMKSIAELSEINMPSFILKLSDSEYSELSHRFKVLAYIQENARPDIIRSKTLSMGALYFRIEDIFKNSRHSQIKISDSYISEVMDYIEKEYAAKLKADNIASRFYISVSKLSADFKHTTGMTLNEFIILIRIKNAKELLKKGMSVAYTAEKCGFSSSAYFIKTFQKYNKITPLKYQYMTRNIGTADDSN